jgi:hypothetical protein
MPNPLDEEAAPVVAAAEGAGLARGAGSPGY